MKKFKDVLNSLNIKEKFTKETRKPDSFNKVSANIPAKANYNQMADLLFLPTTSQGYMYCLVVVDLFTSAFDIQEIKDKQASTVLNAIKEIYKRKYVKEPYGSLQTDSATEFKGIFQKWLYRLIHISNQLLLGVSFMYKYIHMFYFH